MSDDRDYSEEAYWRDYCGECDGKCQSPDRHAAEIAAAQQADAYPYCAKHGHTFDSEQGCNECVAEAIRSNEEWIAASQHPSYWSSTED